MQRIIHYSFISERGLTLHAHAAEALYMFLNSRLYLYHQVYFHRTVRRIDEVLLCGLACHATRPALRDAKVSVDGIRGQVDSRVFGTGLVHEPIIAMSRSCAGT